MKVFYLLFLFFMPLFATLQSELGDSINKQIKFVQLINDDNATQESIMKITTKQKEFYSNLFEELMVKKSKYLNEKYSHESQIYALEKIINLNKKRKNKYAVTRDEVKIKTYKLLDMQYFMIKNILGSLNKHNYNNLKIKMNKIFDQNKLEVSKLNNQNYFDILKIIDNSKVIKQAQQSIIIFENLIEVNNDLIKYLSIFDKKIYTLNKYSQYKLIEPILYINKIPLVKSINIFLSELGFNVIKLILIVFIILVIYFIRIIFYKILEKYIVKIKFLKKYSKDILNSIRKLVEIAIILINIEIVIYVYNDFLSINSVSIFFNVLYGFIFTFIIYRVANAVAKIKINKISVDGNSVKFEIINVGIKILNVTIWIIGLLIILFLVGVDLTAVLSGLGIGGFAIALAAKDSLANFFGTLSILFSDVFSQGDWIKIDGVEGTVVEIGLRVTTIRTFDNAMISIPNGTVSTKDVKNYSRRSLGRRIKMSLGIKYDSSSRDIKNAIDEIYTMLDQHEGIATVNTEFLHNSEHRTRLVRSKDDSEGVKKTLLVYLDSFGDSSINILIYCFSKTVQWSEWLEVKQDVMFKMMEILERNNLEFAFPSLSLYHENNLEVKDLN